MMTTGVLNCYLKDHLGTTRVVLDESGTVVETRDHYPFGMEMPGRSYVSGTKAKENFTGHELDDETGLIYAGARYYMPAVGRWTSVDPLADMYASHSSYNYVLNNPVELFDPDGRCVSQDRMGSECFSYPVFATCPPGTEDCNEQKNEEEEAESNEGVGDQINIIAGAVSLGLSAQGTVVGTAGALDKASRLLGQASQMGASGLNVLGTVASIAPNIPAALGPPSEQTMRARYEIAFDSGMFAISLTGYGAVPAYVLSLTRRDWYVNQAVQNWRAKQLLLTP